MSKKYHLFVKSKKMLADTLTPVNIYLKLRDRYANSILLESSDYHGQENSLSLICCAPQAKIELSQHRLQVQYPDGSQEQSFVQDTTQLSAHLSKFLSSFVLPPQADVFGAGIFGYMNYDVVRYAHQIDAPLHPEGIPDVCYQLYQYIVAIDHFSNTMTLCEISTDPNADDDSLRDLEKFILNNRFFSYHFKTLGEETTDIADADFLEMIEKAKRHCYRGDVFQIVLSRRFMTNFQGDEFNVYRALRSINPSPYLFYFDYGDFKLFGSSPEAQLRVKDGKAHIFPIAGTFRRTGNDQEDVKLADQLTKDEKENAEHLMLVDLARNDLSRYVNHVSVDVFKEVQFYSHVIHLVSKVSGQLMHADALWPLVFDTFPAGTLSGAPKRMAMTLIQAMEKNPRGFYGGAIGFAGFDGSFNHAIMIRTFLSKKNQLTFQAGAGIVAKSLVAGELQEVNNKVEALRKALQLAEKI